MTRQSSALEKNNYLRNKEEERMVSNNAAARIGELEATNATLREALSSQTAHIAMLEEKLLTMSVELASSRAREDEQNLMLRRRSTGAGQQVSSHKKSS